MAEDTGIQVSGVNKKTSLTWILVSSAVIFSLFYLHDEQPSHENDGASS